MRVIDFWFFGGEWRRSSSSSYHHWTWIKSHHRRRRHLFLGLSSWLDEILRYGIANANPLIHNFSVSLSLSRFVLQRKTKAGQQEQHNNRQWSILPHISYYLDIWQQLTPESILCQSIDWLIDWFSWTSRMRNEKWDFGSVLDLNPESPWNQSAQMWAKLNRASSSSSINQSIDQRDEIFFACTPLNNNETPRSPQRQPYCLSRRKIQRDIESQWS